MNASPPSSPRNGGLLFPPLHEPVRRASQVAGLASCEEQFEEHMARTAKACADVSSTSLEACRAACDAVIERIRQLPRSAEEKLEHLAALAKALFTRTRQLAPASSEGRAVADIIFHTAVTDMFGLKADDPNAFNRFYPDVLAGLAELARPAAKDQRLPGQLASSAAGARGASAEVVTKSRLLFAAQLCHKAASAVDEAMKDPAQAPNFPTIQRGLIRATEELYEEWDAQHGRPLNGIEKERLGAGIQAAIDAFTALQDVVQDTVALDRLGRHQALAKNRLTEIAGDAADAARWGYPTAVRKPGGQAAVDTLQAPDWVEGITRAMAGLPADLGRRALVCQGVVSRIQALPCEPAGDTPSVRFTLLARLADGLIDGLKPRRWHKLPRHELNLVHRALQDAVLPALHQLEIPAQGYIRSKVRNIEGWAAWAGHALPMDSLWEASIQTSLRHLKMGGPQAAQRVAWLLTDSHEEGRTTAEQKFEYLALLSDRLVQHVKNMIDWAPDTYEYVAASDMAVIVEALMQLIPALKSLVSQVQMEERESMAHRLDTLDASLVWSRSVAQLGSDMAAATA